MLTISIGSLLGYILVNYFGQVRGMFDKSLLSNSVFVAGLGLMLALIPGATSIGMGMLFTALGRYALNVVAKADIVNDPYLNPKK